LLSLEDAKANCQIIIAALQSAAQGRVVKLAEYDNLTEVI
jgi:hypothetical protein